MSVPGGLGRLPKADPRDFPVALAGMPAAEPVLATAPRYRYWSTTRRLPLNQGETPMCVGYSARGLLYASPVLNPGGPAPDVIYRNAQLLDEIPGEAYDGTTARGAMRFLQSIGLVSAYVWPRTVAEMMAWILTRGPVLLGCDWYESFDRPGSDHVLRIAPGAGVRGGHEIMVNGGNLDTGRARIMNSWGLGWADHGRAWLPFEVLEELLAGGADICAPTELVGKTTVGLIA